MPQDQSNRIEPTPASVEDMEFTLGDIARRSAQAMLQKALEAEVEAYLNSFAEAKDENGHKVVVRNGHAPERSILTGIGALEVSRPRVDERKAVANDAEHPRFASGILPRFLRRTPSVDGVVAVLYLKGISGNDFEAALKAIYGEQAGSLSASTVSRLKDVWIEEYEQWRKGTLEASQYAYIWADGVHFNVRMKSEKNCILVVIGAKFNGEKELLAISDDMRESETSSEIAE